MWKYSLLTPERPSAARLSSWSSMHSALERQPPSLEDLPIEIIDRIIHYVLPDLTDFRSSFRHGSSLGLFTSPILQTCQLVRQRCLAIINALYAWVEIRTSDTYLEGLLIDGTGDLSPLPVLFQQYVAKDAACVRLVCYRSPCTIIPSRRSFDESSMRSFTVPYNFDTLIRICDGIGKLGFDMIIDSVIVEVHRTHRPAQKAMRDLLVPALSPLRNVSRCDFKLDYDYTFFDGEQGVDRHGFWDIMRVTQRATAILQHVKTLEGSGYVDEASILLLSSIWIKEEATEYLPLEEDDEDSLSPEDNNGLSISSQSQTLEILQLQKLIRDIERRIPHAYAYFIRKYGCEWLGAHESITERWGMEPIDGPFHLVWPS